MNRPAHYSMAKRPGFITVNRRADISAPERLKQVDIIAVDSATECHVTPIDVAARMADYLGRPWDGARLLEPSAGTGNLVRAAQASGWQTITMIERHWRLAESIGAVNSCFLEWSKDAPRFDRVIMNPPFSQIKAHMRATQALSDYIVAIVPITFESPNFETLEELPIDTFATCKVRTKIVQSI